MRAAFGRGFLCGDVMDGEAMEMQALDGKKHGTILRHLPPSPENQMHGSHREAGTEQWGGRRELLGMGLLA